ncbi:MAG: N-6 DNA methylase [Rickettsia endosymbiont of Oxypoda opaca]|nr:N-6 DNA methylase [Rickettsia endosymbiont of Oxypoda opaca]
MLSEADIRLEIDEALKNKGWKLSGKDKNVFTEKNTSVGCADYILKPCDREHPLVIIEAKRKGKDLNEALKQAQRYAEEFKSPIAYASDGSTIKTIHLRTSKPLILNGEEIEEFLSEDLALKFLDTNEYNTIDKQIIKSRKELINIFASANKELRKEGMQAGIERFSEFCNILFLKIFSEEEDKRHEQNLNPRIPKDFNWDKFRGKDGNDLLYYVNDTVLKHFQEEYGTDIFAPLKIKNPITLKRIIDSLDSLSLVDTNSDIKGDAFEYFLKAYLANQNKDLGEYFTPRHIVKTLVKLVNPKFGETVYDPFCGTGGMLIEAFKHIYNKMPRNERTLQQLRQETIYGSEITTNARITKMNMILTGDGHNNILRQDSLKKPSQRKYDVVITNMPFSLGNYDDYSGLYKLGSSNSNSLCIEHCFDAIDSKSGNPRIGMVIPEGILFDNKYTKLREYIYKNSYVEDIVSLPSGAFKPYTDVKTSILYLTKVTHVTH